jgi:hypothetical protein
MMVYLVSWSSWRRRSRMVYVINVMIQKKIMDEEKEEKDSFFFFITKKWWRKKKKKRKLKKKSITKYILFVIDIVHHWISWQTKHTTNIWWQKKKERLPFL